MTLPCNPELEKTILGSIMLDWTFLDQMRSKIEDADWSLEKHRRIWSAVCRLYDSRRPVDEQIVCMELMRLNELEACDGLSYIAFLTEGVPKFPHIDEYVVRLHELTTRRRAMHEAQTLLATAQDERNSLGEVLDGFSAAAVRLQSIATADNDVVSTRDMLASDGPDRLLGPRSTCGGVPMPWMALDHSVGPLQGGQLVVLLGETSRGKTSFALQQAARAAREGAVLIWTMEMTPRSLFRRLVNQMSGTAANPAQLTFEERNAQREALAFLQDHPIHFDSRSRSVSAFVGACRRLRQQSRLVLGVMDYLQRIPGSGRPQNRAVEVSENSRALKLAAMDLGIPLLVLSQVDRTSVKGGGEIGLHSAKESGDIENDADVLMWIKSAELSRDSETDVKIHVGKQREGPAGFDVPMVFRPQSQTFMESEQ
jgi:replicative DNA helicase